MYEREDGCLIIGLCVCGSVMLTFFTLLTVMGSSTTPNSPGQSSGRNDLQIVLICLGAWVFTIGLIVAEAVRGQARRPRK